MPLYAAYGSNLDTAQMLLRAPHSPAQGSGWLVGWRLTFGGEERGFEGALATVVEHADGQVFVMLYDVPAWDEPGLDHWETTDLGVYHKIKVRVATLDGDVTAWIYVIDGFEGGLPLAQYIGMLADAAESAGAPSDYVTDLRLRPCRSNGAPDNAADLDD